MTKAKELTVKDIWEEYQKGEVYHQQIELHETVKKNEQFFEGRQWASKRTAETLEPSANAQ